MDKYKFHDLVDQHIHPNVKLKTTDDIDIAVNNFTKLIQSVAWFLRSNLHILHPPPLIPEYIRSIIIETCRSRAIY